MPIFAQVGGVYLNFGLWPISLLPAWMVVRQIGCGGLGNKKVNREMGPTGYSDQGDEEKEKSVVIVAEVESASP